MSHHLNIRKTLPIALAFVWSAVFTSALHAQAPAAAPMPPASAAHGSAGMMHLPAMAGGGMDMKGMMAAMNDKMGSMKSTGNADVDFAMMMRIHHLGAIDMAQAQLKNGKSPEMNKMAKQIIADQNKEIKRFDAYLAKNGRPTEQMKK